MLPQFDLAGRTALVTGAASGIGQAVAVGLAEAGADLVLLSDQTPLDETRARITSLGRSAEGVVLDLADAEAVAPTARDLLDRRQVDILVNAAGIIRRQPAAEFTDSNWRDVLEVNLTAARSAGSSPAPCCAAVTARSSTSPRC